VGIESRRGFGVTTVNEYRAMLRRPPSEWDDDMQLDEVIELDEHEDDVRLEDHDLDFLMMAREEGEGFVEYMEQRMQEIDVDESVNVIMDELDPGDRLPDYDPEDVYTDGEFSDEDDWPSDSDSYEEEGA
jgi:hypothetical protein